MSETRSLTRNPHTHWQRLVEDNLKSLGVGGTNSGFGSTHSVIVKDMATNKVKTSPSDTKCVVKRESNNEHMSSSRLQRDWSIRMEKDRANLDQERKEHQVQAVMSNKRYPQKSLNYSPAGHKEHDGKRLMASTTKNKHFGNSERFPEERSVVDQPDKKHFINETRQGHCSGKLGNTNGGCKLKYNRNQPTFPHGQRERFNQSKQQPECVPDLFGESEAGVMSAGCRGWTSGKKAENDVSSEITRKSRWHLDRKHQIKSEQRLNNDIECARHDDDGLRMKDSIKTQTTGRKRRRERLRKTTSRAYWDDSLNDPVTSDSEVTKYKETIVTGIKFSMPRPHMTNNHHNENIGDGFPSPCPQKLDSGEEQSSVSHTKVFDQSGEIMERNNQLETFALPNSMMSKKKVIFNEEMMNFSCNRWDLGAGGDWVFQSQNWQRTQSDHINALDNLFPNGRVDSPDVGHFLTGPWNDCQRYKGGLFHEVSEEERHTLFSNKYQYRYQSAVPRCSSPRLMLQRSTSWSAVSVEEINRLTRKRFSKPVEVRNGKKRQNSGGLIVDRGSDSKWRCVVDSLVGEKSCLLKKDTDSVCRLSPHAVAEIQAETTLDKVHLSHGHLGFDLEVKSGRRSIAMSVSETSLLTFHKYRCGEKFGNIMFSSNIRRFDLGMTKLDSNNETPSEFSNASCTDNVIYPSTKRGYVKESTEEENFLNGNHSPPSISEIQYLHDKESNSRSSQILFSRTNCRLFERQIACMEGKDREADETEEDISSEERIFTKNNFEHKYKPIAQGGVIGEDFDSVGNSESELLPNESKCLIRGKGHEAEPKIIEENCQTMTTDNMTGGNPVSRSGFLENRYRQPEDKLAFDESKNDHPSERPINNLKDFVKLGKVEARNVNFIEMKSSHGNQIGNARDDWFQASHVPSQFLLMGEKDGPQSDDLGPDEIKVKEEDEDVSGVHVSHDGFLNASQIPDGEEGIKNHLKKEFEESDNKKEPFENKNSDSGNSWIRQSGEYFPLPQGKDAYQISLQTVQPKEQYDFCDMCKSDVDKVVGGKTLVRKDIEIENKAEKDGRTTRGKRNLVRCASYDDLHQSSLECLLEQLIHRGKIQTACIFSLKREVLALSKNAPLSQNDVTVLCDGAMGRYDGLMKITLFDDIVFTCFQWDDYTMFMGRSACTVLVSKLGANSLVVGFAPVTTSGSCMKEMTEFAQVLKGRGL